MEQKKKKNSPPLYLKIIVVPIAIRHFRISISITFCYTLMSNVFSHFYYKKEEEEREKKKRRKKTDCLFFKKKFIIGFKSDQCYVQYQLNPP